MTPPPAALEKNIPKVMVLNCLWMFLVIMPVVVPFLQQYELTMTQIFELQTVFALCIVLFEVPSGYLADLFGRKNSLVVGSLFHGIAFTLLATSDSFSGFVVFEIFAALGQSFFSGSDVALLYDTEAALGEEERTTRMLGRKLMWGQIGETVAAPLGGALALGGLWWPAHVNAAVAWLPLVVAVTLIEPPRSRATFHHRENFRQIFRVIFRTTALLRWSFLALVAYGLATLLAVWAFQGFWKELGIPLGWFGVLWALYNLIVALVGRVAHSVEERYGTGKVVAAIGLLPVVGYGGMALCALDAVPAAVAIVGGVVAGFAFQVGRGLNQVVVKSAVNRGVPSELRATANSLSSLGVRILFAGLGPLLGWIIDRDGYDAGFGAYGGLYAVVFVVLCLPLVWALRGGGSTEDTASEG